MGDGRGGGTGVNYVPKQGFFEAEAPGTARLVANLLATRASTAGAGNRRPLFAAMDLLLAEGEGEGSASLPAGRGTAAEGRPVRLERIRLFNWKAFERADIVIPEAGPDRPVVVIGGSNGYGKSSILEAFVLGLFGRRAISDVGFLTQAGGGRGEQRRAYRNALECNLHRSKKARDDGVCSVTLDFATPEGPVSVERKWYFEEDGRLIEDEEELLLRVGDDRRLLATPAGLAAADWYEEEIDRRVMPSGLAPFFVFDGEQVERWAERQLTDQVRSAVARMLGIESLRELVGDLLAFARDRERDSVGDGSPGGRSDAVEIERLERELRTVSKQLETSAATLARLREAREVALRRVAALEGGSHADLQELLQGEHRLAAEHASLTRELASVLAEHGPALLAGEGLLRRTVDAIEAACGWQGPDLAPDEIDAAWARFASADPPLGEKLTASLRRRFAEALGTGPAARAEDAHGHLDRQSRRSVAARLRKAFGDGRNKVKAAAAAAAEVAVSIDALTRAAAEGKRRSADLAAAQAELMELSAATKAAEAERGSLSRSAVGIVARLNPLKEEAMRRASRLQDAAPRLRVAARARSLSTTLNAHLADIAEGEHRRLGEEVTRSYRTLSHKDQLARIDIGVDGDVTLFDPSGRDVTDYRLSAGESQLFALALITAVGTIVGDRLPLLIDTPLSRLDTRHREGVLDMLSARRSQTILLTQPEEINARHLARLKPVLGAALHLVHSIDPASGVGISSIKPGYDPDGGDANPPRRQTDALSA